MSFTTIKYGVEAGIARLTLNRPEKMNSFNAEMHQEILAALTQAKEDDSVRVLVLTGEGRAFSAGQDLGAKEVAFGPSGEAPDFEAVVQEFYKPLVLALRTLPFPTIAAVNGVAAGAGVSLALACDFIVAIEKARFILAFAQIGLIPDTGASWFLPRYIGHAKAMGLALLGEPLFATEAEKMGLIWSAVQEEEFASEVEKLATQVSRMPTPALVEIRQLIERSYSHTLEEHLDDEARVMGQLGKTENYLEGVSAFSEKRAPKFKGRN